MRASISYRDLGQAYVVPLGAEHVVVGTLSSATIRIEDPTVTRRHARVSFEAGRYWVEDLGSDNGTYVNGARVRRHALSDGDRVQCGRLELLFSDPEGYAPSALRGDHPEGGQHEAE